MFLLHLIPKINDYLEMLSSEEVKDFVAINFSENFKSTSEEQNLREFANSLYIFLATPDEMQLNSSDNCRRHYNVMILNLFDPELQWIGNKPVIKNKKHC